MPSGVPPGPGNQPSWTEKSDTSAMALTNEGVAVATPVPSSTVRSTAPGRRAAMMPPATPRTATSSAEYPTSSAVPGRRETMREPTSWWNWVERPKSPCRTPPSHFAYWTGSGSSRWYCVRSAATASGVAGRPWSRKDTGSPGARCTVPNTMNEVTSSTATRPSRRLIR